MYHINEKTAKNKTIISLHVIYCLYIAMLTKIMEIRF